MDRIEIHTEVGNQARDHRLRVHFPVEFAPEVGDYDGHFEVVGRKVGVEDFDRSWVEQPRPEKPQRACRPRYGNPRGADDRTVGLRLCTDSIDGKGWLARGYNLSSEEIEVKLKAGARVCNLAEEVVEDQGFTIPGFTIPGKKILTVRWEM